jgi:hypothetical protein
MGEDARGRFARVRPGGVTSRNTDTSRPCNVGRRAARPLHQAAIPGRRRHVARRRPAACGRVAGLSTLRPHRSAAGHRDSVTTQLLNLDRPSFPVRLPHATLSRRSYSLIPRNEHLNIRPRGCGNAISSDLRLLDSYTPANEAVLNAMDYDLGSNSPLSSRSTMDVGAAALGTRAAEISHTVCSMHWTRRPAPNSLPEAHRSIGGTRTAASHFQTELCISAPSRVRACVWIEEK